MGGSSQPPTVWQVVTVKRNSLSLQTILMIIVVTYSSLLATSSEQPLPLNKMTLLACIIYDLAHDGHVAVLMYKRLHEQASFEHEETPAAQELWSKIKKYYEAIKVGGTLLIFAAACYLLYQLYFFYWLDVPCQSSLGFFIEKAPPEKECSVDYHQQPVECTLPHNDDVPQLPQIETSHEQKNILTAQQHLPVHQQENQLNEAKQPEARMLSSDTVKITRFLFDYELCEKVANQIEHMKWRGMTAAAVPSNVYYARPNLEERENRKFNELVAAQVEHMRAIGLN